jgi:hypothetical protein
MDKVAPDYLAESERDPRIRLPVLRKITSEQQAKALKLAEAWVSGMTLAEVGIEHQMTDQQVRRYLTHYGSYRWAVEERSKGTDERWEPPSPPVPPPVRPRRPPPPEEPPARVRPRFAWRTGLSQREREQAKAIQAQANKEWRSDRQTTNAVCPQCDAMGDMACRTPNGTRLSTWHKVRRQLGAT